MKVWRVHYRDEEGSHGFSFHRTRRAAKEAAGPPVEGAQDEIESFEVEVTAAGIIRALNMYADHPDNG